MATIRRHITVIETYYVPDGEEGPLQGYLDGEADLISCEVTEENLEVER